MVGAPPLRSLLSNRLLSNGMRSESEAGKWSAAAAPRGWAGVRREKIVKVTSTERRKLLV
jgi:hypothetical protein